MSKIRVLISAISLAAILGFLPLPALSQLTGFNIKGDLGLKAGSQAPPGAYAGGLFYWYDTDRINNRFGDRVNPGGELNIFLGAPLFNWVTPKKILGANYGFLVALPILNTSLESPNFALNPDPGVSDLYVVPLSLGWHFGRADINAGYGFFAPTGRYTAGANDNTGLGMWGHELSLGTTVYLTESKAWHAATSGAFEFHGGKEDSDAQVGTLLTLEGGLGRAFLQGAANAGLIYYAQWKLTEDTLTGLPALLVQGKNRVAALGPELSMPLATRNTLFGFVTVRYLWEVYARTTTQGNTLVLQAMFPLRPINIAPPPPNRAPTASCSATPSTVIAGSGTPVNVQATGSDPDSDVLSYVWSATGGAVEGTGGQARWNSTDVNPGTYRISAQISDGKGGAASCDAEVRVDPRPNRPPTVAVAADRSAVLVGERVRFTATGNDPDNDSLTYAWQANAGRIAGTGASADLDTTGLPPGNYTATVRVEDGRGGASDAAATVAVNAPPPPPMASKISEAAFSLNSSRVDNVGKRILDDVAVRLQNDPRATVVIVGYADPSERMPDALAGNRANNAANYLAADKGIARNRIATRMGTGQAGAGQANRRVDLIWVPEGATY